MGFMRTLTVDRLKIFVDSREDAFRLAQEDADQFVIDSIWAWRGDPEKRTTLGFEIKFADGEIVWKPWDIDLFNTVQYEEFINLHRELHLLLFTVENARIEAKRINAQPITEVFPGDIVYVDLRYFGTYENDHVFNLDDKHHVQYLVKMTYS